MSSFGLVRASQSPRFVRSALAILAFVGLSLLLLRRGFSFGKEPDVDQDIRDLLAATEQQSWPFDEYVANNGPGQSANYFEHYRQNDTCHIDSRALYAPSTRPECGAVPDLLQSMTYGRRAFQDGPFHPYACNLRWYSPDEVCGILSRFERVWVVGDSLMRHVTSALHIILRQDLIEGAIASWTARQKEHDYQRVKEQALKAGQASLPDAPIDCRCERVFSNGSCLFMEAWSSSSVRRHDPGSIKCDESKCAGFELINANNFPIEKGTLGRLTSALADSRPADSRIGAGTAGKMHAVVMGSGLWYDLQVDKFQQWLIQIQRAVLTTLDDAYGSFNVPKIPMLAITPSAGGPLKPHKYVDKQNNRHIKAFELSFAKWLAYRQARGYTGSKVSHLGTYNATILSSSPDGTHSGMKADLLKAMMVLNWLDLVSR